MGLKQYETLNDNLQLQVFGFQIEVFQTRKTIFNPYL